jgi:hypothetical protein
VVNEEVPVTAARAGRGGGTRCIAARQATTAAGSRAHLRYIDVITDWLAMLASLHPSNRPSYPSCTSSGDTGVLVLQHLENLTKALLLEDNPDAAALEAMHRRLTEKLITRECRVRARASCKDPLHRSSVFEILAFIPASAHRTQVN